MAVISWGAASSYAAFIKLSDETIIASNNSIRLPLPSIALAANANSITGKIKCAFGHGGVNSTSDIYQIWKPPEASNGQIYIESDDRGLAIQSYAFNATAYFDKNTYKEAVWKILKNGSWVLPSIDGNGRQFEDVSTDILFNKNNSASITNNIYINIQNSPRHSYLQLGNPGVTNSSAPTSKTKVITVTLDAPPTFSHNVDTAEIIYKNVIPYKVTIFDSEAQYGGDIVSSVLTVGNQTATGSGDGTLSITPNTTGAFTPVVSVTDSRGQVTKHTLPQIIVNDYNAPSILNYRIARCDTNGKLQDDGENAILTVNYSYFNAVTNLKKPITKNGDTDVSATTTWYTTYDSSTGVSNPITFPYSAPATGTIYGVIRSELDKDSSFPISLQLVDGLDRPSTTTTQTLPPTFYTIDFLAGGKGVAFGAPSREEIFKVAMPTDFLDMTSVEIDAFIQALGLHGRTICPYDVGDIYITRNSTNPATKWQGTTWRQIKDTFLLAAGDDYTAGDTGGEAEVTLTQGQLPKISGHISPLAWKENEGTGAFSKGTSNFNLRNATSGTANSFGAQYYNLSIGNDEPHENMPPYLVVYAWERLS